MNARISKKAVRREACRVAAAFEITFFRPWDPTRGKVASHFNGRTKQQVELTWVLDLPRARWKTIYVFGGGGEDERSCSIDLSRSNFLYLHTDSRYNEIMARGLYRLGFSDESVVSQLPQLTAHEKLELRLSLPREFWPQKWLDEEAA